MSDSTKNSGVCSRGCRPFLIVLVSGVILATLLLASLYVLTRRGDPSVPREWFWFQGISAACQEYKNDMGEYPEAATLSELLKILTQKAADGRGPWFRARNAADLVTDHWGANIKLSTNADGQCMLTSAGPDRKYGTQDDIEVLLYEQIIKKQ